MTLIPHDSPLHKLPTSLDRRMILFLDGIRYSFQIFELASTRLSHTLEDLSFIDQNPVELNSRIASAISDAWTMIDSTHRLRELFQQIPGLRRKEPKLQLFMRRTAITEDLRNFFQHFRNEIDAFVDHSMPLWGAISWIYTDKKTGEEQNFSIMPGTFFLGASVFSCDFNLREKRFNERTRFQVGPKKVDLADLENWMTEFVIWYSEWFCLKFTGTEYHESDKHFRLRLKFTPYEPPK